VWFRSCSNIVDGTTAANYTWYIDSQGIVRQLTLPSSYGTQNCVYQTHVPGAIVGPSHACISTRDGFTPNVPAVPTQSIVLHNPFGCPLDCAATQILISTTAIPLCPPPHPSAVCNITTARWEIQGPIAINSFNDTIWCPTHVYGDITNVTGLPTLKFSSCGRLTASGTIDIAGTNLEVNSTYTRKYNAERWPLIDSTIPNGTMFNRATLNPPVFGWTPCQSFDANYYFGIQFTNTTCTALLPASPSPSDIPLPTPTPATPVVAPTPVVATPPSTPTTVMPPITLASRCAIGIITLLIATLVSLL